MKERYLERAMIIGVTGTNGSGKSTVVEILQSRGFHVLSLSDFLRDEAERRGLPPKDRTTLRQLGNELREEYGAGYLMEQALGSIRRPMDSYVIDSIRNPAEAEALMRSKHNTMFLGIDASPHIRYKRIVERAAATGRIEAMKTYDEFLRDEEVENRADPNCQRLRATLDLAEIVFLNNGTEEELAAKVIRHLNRMPDAYAAKLGWEEYFMTIAKDASRKSSCVKRHVGAIIVRDKKILATGYNGTPKGVQNCDQGGCERCNDDTIPSGERLEECICVHAEQNAIAQAALSGARVDNAEIYSTTLPCIGCAKLLINAGVTRIFYGEDYPNTKSKELLAGVKVPLIQQSWR